MKISSHGPESGYALNPRVSVFEHNGSFYLFDPFSRTYASMNGAMISLLKDTDSIKPGHDRNIIEIVQKLKDSDILIPASSDDISGKYITSAGNYPVNHFTVFITTRCNLRCAYCYANGGDSEATIRRDIWKPAMDHFFSNLRAGKSRQDPKTIYLSIHGGGEPTVEFDILKKVFHDFTERALSEGFQTVTGMGTNGTYDDSVHKWIVDNNISVSVSLDGPAEIQNRMRPFRSGKPSYEIVVHNLRKLVRDGQKAAIRATITGDAVGTMEETIMLAKEIGINSVHFEPVSLTGRCKSGALLKPDPDKFADEFLKCFLTGLKYDIDVHYSGMRCFKTNHANFCGACGQNFCITPAGDITTCYEVLEPHDPASGEFFIGKVDPFNEKVEVYQERIDKLKLRITEKIEKCSNCFLRYQCAGDCPAKSFRYSMKDIFTPDPYRCRIAEKINRQLIVWLADGEIDPRESGPKNIFLYNRF